MFYVSDLVVGEWIVFTGSSPMMDQFSSTLTVWVQNTLVYIPTQILGLMYLAQATGGHTSVLLLLSDTLLFSLCVVQVQWLKRASFEIVVSFACGFSCARWVSFLAFNPFSVISPVLLLRLPSSQSLSKKEWSTSPSWSLGLIMAVFGNTLEKRRLPVF